MGRIRVLVVDDSALMRRLFGRLLEESGFQVIDTAADGEEAVRKICASKPDVVSLDLEMPVLDGLGVLRRVMEHCPVPVVMLSSLTTEGAMATMQALALGAVDFVPKPSNSAELEQIIDELRLKLRTAAGVNAERLAAAWRRAQSPAGAPAAGRAPLPGEVSGAGPGPGELRRLFRETVTPPGGGASNAPGAGRPASARDGAAAPADAVPHTDAGGPPSEKGTGGAGAPAPAFRRPAERKHGGKEEMDAAREAAREGSGAPVARGAGGGGPESLSPGRDARTVGGRAPGGHDARRLREDGGGAVESLSSGRGEEAPARPAGPGAAGASSARRERSASGAFPAAPGRRTYPGAASGRTVGGAAPGAPTVAPRTGGGPVRPAGAPPTPPPDGPGVHTRRTRVDLVVIGCSTGGPAALHVLIPALPEDFPVPVVVVQHIPPGFSGPLAEHLDRSSRLTVRHAAMGDALAPGTVLVAPAGFELTFTGRPGAAAVHLDPGRGPVPPGGFRPSVDAVMLAAVETFGARVMGVLLTGMGRDGAKGMAAIHGRGGPTIAEDESTCVVFGMPRAAIELGAARVVAPLHRVAAEMVRLV